MAKSISDIRTLGEDDPIKNAEVSNKLRHDWNDYVDHLQQKGLKGSPLLDKNDMGGREIDEYRKINPSTSVSRETVLPIQQELSNYRDWSIGELRNKRATLADAENPTGRFVTPTENLDGYMRDLSKKDGYAGQRTTSYKFPDRFMNSFDANNKLTVQNLGFATTKR